MNLEERIALIKQIAPTGLDLIIEAEKLEADIQAGKDRVVEQDRVLAKLRSLGIVEWKRMSRTLRKRSRPMSMLTKDEKLAVLKQDVSTRTPTTYANHTTTTSNDQRGGRFAAKQVIDVWKPAYWAEADCGVAPPLGYSISDVPDMETLDGLPRQPSSAPIGVGTPNLTVS